MNRLSRRDFLKFASVLPLGLAIPSVAKILHPLPFLQSRKKNVIVIVFDAFSAYHLPIYGYPRNTAPNISHLAERAVVYHNHYASANFTTPATASLLTGALPWSHRALHYYNTVTESFTDKNLFSAFQNYYRIGFSHNPLANTLLRQFSGNLDEFVPWNTLLLTTDGFVDTLFKRDEDIAGVAWTRAIKREEDRSTYLLFLSELYETYMEDKIKSFKPSFPRGLPNVKSHNFFLLEDAIDWVKRDLTRYPQPFLGYFHFMPPHAPYKTHKDFYETFADDGFRPPVKPEDFFTEFNPNKKLRRDRSWYDEFILYLDREFGRLFAHLESSGMLEDTWVVLTADHGELFERGVEGHVSPLLYQPVVRIPLMIFEPGRTARTDVYAKTSAVDLLPTLLHVTGENPVDWTEGTVLPPYSSVEPRSDRIIYSLNATRNRPEAALTNATAMIVADNYKLTYFFGYEELGNGVERVELYDIAADPEELNDLYAQKKETGSALLGQLKEKLREVNQPYT
jgi:Arylsulfatase A and related enzymes